MKNTHHRLACSVFVLSFMIWGFTAGIVPRASAQEAELGEILHRVESNAPALKAAHANTEIYQANKKEGLGALFGNINAFSQLQFYNDNRLTRPISPPINFSTLPYDSKQIGYGLSLSLPLDINGQILTRLNALTHQERAANLDEKQAGLTLLNRAANFYRGIEAISGKIDALQRQSDAIKKQQTVTEVAVKVGRRPPVDQLRMQSELSKIDGQIADAHATDARLRAYLASLMGSDAFTDSVMVPSNQPDAKLNSLLNVANRPDIQSLQEKKKAARSGLNTAREAWLPKAFVQASWMENQGFNGKGKNDPFWGIGITVNLPLWTGGVRSARIQEAKAKEMAVSWQHETVLASANAEIKSALSDWVAREKQFTAADQSLKTAKEVMRIQTEQYRQGRLSVTDFLDAAARLAFARASYAAALAGWWQADDNLRLAQGLPPSAYSH